ncbi:comta [Symbiodinium pilosum]|uniref:catechol O-methyltransferase n=1 Tax=Symbiodinium pilosum TaxID=2952 RepID=A0A812W8H2_SYMPI|nr:comta [Symbiodinium pilosum]
MDPVLALIARQMVAHAGLEAVVQIQLGHSEVRLDRLCGSSSFDLVFFDQRGSRFREDLEKLEEMGALHPKAVLIADNVLKPGAPTFLWYVCAAPGWRSLIVELGDFGPCGVLDWMSVSQKVAAEQRSQESPELPEKIQHLAWQADEMRWRSIDYHVTPQEWTAFAEYMKASLEGVASHNSVRIVRISCPIFV